MSIRSIALITAVLAFASVSSAQTSGQVFTGRDSKACVPQENRRAKKQKELVEIQARMTRLHGAIAALEEGIVMQQNIEGMGQLHAKMGGAAGIAKVTKAMSDTILDLTQSYSPFVKKTYDAFDALVATGAAVYAGNGTHATASGFSAVQNGNTAYISYKDLQDPLDVRRKRDPLAILPQTAQTPGRIAAAVRMTDDLSRGDLTGAGSRVLAEVGTMVDKNSKTTRLALQVGSKATAGMADRPGKTMDSRVADELGALGDVGKLVANAAHTRGAGELAAIVGRSGRLLGYSGMMLENVSRAKQGLGEAADMYGEYRKIEERSAKEREKLQQQIGRKSQEIAHLEMDARRIVGEIRQAEAEILSCRVADETRVAKAERSNRTVPATRGSYERVDRTSWRAASSYGAAWDRQAKKQQIDRLLEDRRRQIIDRAASGRTMGNAVIRPATPEANPNFASGSSYRDGTPAPAPPARPQYDSVKKCNHGDDCPNQ